MYNKEYMDANREHWNELVPIHTRSAFYDVEGFKEGNLSLKSIETEELGDVSGKSLLHLQCHFGEDTMSWARLGAKVTGIDFSDKAIDAARLLSTELGIDARFILSNLYDLPDKLEEKFDIVFTSYGAIYWLPDIWKWGQIVSSYLKPGGTFYIIEFHPLIGVFDSNADKTGIELLYGYFQGDGPLEFESDGEGSYADPSATVTTTMFEWSHSLGDIVSSLISSGLKVEFLHEFPYSCYQRFPIMKQGDDGFWRLPDSIPMLPIMFSIKATK